MKSQALRWTLLGLFVAVLVTAAYLLWASESASRSASASARAFDERAESLTRAVMDLRMGQQAYVAAGQGDEFWGSRVAARIAGLREELAAVRALASSARAQSEVDDAASALGDFERMDARAREYARGNQRLLASDLIFSDGLDKTDTMLRGIQAARTVAAEGASALVRATRQREIIVAGATAAAALLLGLLLVPTPKAETAAAGIPTAARVRAPLEIRAPIEEDVLVLRDARDPAPPPPPVPVPLSMRETDAEARDLLDLGKVAALCSELARIVDTRALPAVLERTATVLDANGVVLWIADPDGRELNPIVTHGYPAQLVTRLGTIPRDAQNATAAAFRTALLQTVSADSISNGAIAVPLVTPGGCVGVMAAEVRHGGEKQDAKLAAAAIVAAQLATLVGPPTPRGQTRPEAANA
jgi:GAF domain-containing protein